MLNSKIIEQVFVYQSIKNRTFIKINYARMEDHLQYKLNIGFEVSKLVTPKEM